ncbi:hypothetical protein WKW50_16510 [Ochrobactrum sp. GPK 3]
MAEPTEGLPLGIWGVMTPDHDIFGSRQLNQPINFLPRNYDGDVQRTYFHDYYNRVWFVPTAVDFGPITTTTSKQVFIWNAHVSRVTLTEVAMPDDATLSITGLTLPRTFNALAGTYFTMWVAADGDPSIDGVFSFMFSPTETITLRAVGIRSRLWEFMPNWNDGYEVVYNFSSEIITSDSGKEQRRAIRQTPRKQISFSSLVNEQSFRKFIRHMSVWHGRSTIMPEFDRSVHLSSDVFDGQSSLRVDAAPDWLVAGRLVVVTDKVRFMLRTVEGVSGDIVSFTSTVDGDWLAGTRLFSAVSGRLATSITGTQHTNRTATIAVTFDAAPGVETWPDFGTAKVVHRGREVLLRRPNWGSPPSPEFTSALTQVDYGAGLIDNFLPITFYDRVNKAEYLGLNTDDVTEIIKFYLRQYGQVGEFFMPSFTEDLLVSQVSAAGTSNLRMAGPGTAQDYVDGTVYRDLIVFMQDGTYHMRHVSSIYTVDDAIGNDSIIQVDSPWPVELTPDNIRQICWMPLWRFISDGLTVSYVTNQVAQVAQSMKTLEYMDEDVI